MKKDPQNPLFGSDILQRERERESDQHDDVAQLAELPTRGMTWTFEYVSTLKVEPHTWPSLSTLGIAFILCRGCSKLCRPPRLQYMHPAGNGANDLPQPSRKRSLSSEKTSDPSAAVPQKSATDPSGSAAANTVVHLESKRRKAKWPLKSFTT
eukprot:Gb_16790 [translate_table: standard]